MNFRTIKNLLTLCFVLLAIQASAQWQNIHTFSNPACALITSENILYAGLGGGGVYASQDSGAAWLEINNGIQFGGAYIFSFAARNDSIFAGGFGEVNFSENGGSDWSLLNLNLGPNSFVYSLIIKDHYLFAGVGHDTGNGIYRKQMNEPGWTPVSEGLPENVGVNALATVNNALFAGTDAGVYYSTNNGLDWSQSGNGIAPGLSVKSLIVSNMNILAGTTDGVFYSADNGNSWSAATGIPPGSVVTCFTGNDQYVVAGTYESACFSADNGMKWTRYNDGLDSIVSFYSLTSLGNNIFAGTGAGISTINAVFKLTYAALSVNENDYMTGNVVNVSPNPFSDNTIISCSIFLHNATLLVENFTGRTVKRMDHINGQSVMLRGDGLSTGLYMVRLQQDHQTIASIKIVITDRQ